MSQHSQAYTFHDKIKKQKKKSSPICIFTVNAFESRLDFRLLPWLSKVVSAQRTITHILDRAETSTHRNQSLFVD
jgi:hypothetical protein